MGLITYAHSAAIDVQFHLLSLYWDFFFFFNKNCSTDENHDPFCCPAFLYSPSIPLAPAVSAYLPLPENIMSPYYDTWLFSLPVMNTPSPPTMASGTFLSFQNCSQFLCYLLISLFHQTFFFLFLCFFLQILTIVFITLRCNYMHVSLNLSKVPENIISFHLFTPRTWLMWTHDKITALQVV